MCSLLSVAREKAGLKSNNQVAIALGVSAELVSRWETDKSKPNGLNTLKLMKLGNISTNEGLRLVENGFVSLPILFVTSFGSALALAWSYISPTVYIMLN